MKCRKCAQVIDDDSKFCKFCGHMQNSSQVKKKIKGYQIAVLCLWIVINLSGVLSYTHGDANRRLFPLNGLDTGYYDFSEFLLYGIGGCVLLLIIWLYKNER